MQLFQYVVVQDNKLRSFFKEQLSRATVNGCAAFSRSSRPGNYLRAFEPVIIRTSGVTSLSELRRCGFPLHDDTRLGFLRTPRPPLTHYTSFF